jgi:hypothetical protein
MRALYGNPDANNDGAADPSWAAKYLTTIIPPYRMVLAWDKKAVVSRITVNKGCAAALLASLKGIRDHYGSQAALEKARMHLFGGVYNFRPKRQGKTLSMHAYGAAIDLDPDHNGQGRPVTMPAEVVAIFDAQGADWGGRWSPKSRDGMHFQFARVK